MGFEGGADDFWCSVQQQQAPIHRDERMFSPCWVSGLKSVAVDFYVGICRSFSPTHYVSASTAWLTMIVVASQRLNERRLMNLSVSDLNWGLLLPAPLCAPLHWRRVVQQMRRVWQGITRFRDSSLHASSTDFIPEGATVNPSHHRITLLLDSVTPVSLFFRVSSHSEGSVGGSCFMLSVLPPGFYKSVRPSSWKFE